MSCYLIRRFLCKYPATLNVNLYKTHFSYIIHDLSVYTHSYNCKKCGKLWHRFWGLDRHEKTCKNWVLMLQKNFVFIRFGQLLTLSVILLIPICRQIVQRSTGWLGTRSLALVYVPMPSDLVYRIVLYKRG